MIGGVDPREGSVSSSDKVGCCKVADGRSDDDSLMVGDGRCVRDCDISLWNREKEEGFAVGAEDVGGSLASGRDPSCREGQESVKSCRKGGEGGKDPPSPM